MRRKNFAKRTHQPDQKYTNVTIGRFVNYLMRNGKKSVAEKVLYDAFSAIEQKTKQEGLKVFEKAMENVFPVVEVGTRRIGGANYQVPKPVREDRKFVLAARWIIAAARAKKGIPMSERLADEIIAAYKNEGSAIKKKQDVHRMAEANRAFAHLGR